MIITRKYMDRLVKAGNARVVGTVVSNGWRYYVINRLDLQRTDHAIKEPSLF